MNQMDLYYRGFKDYRFQTEDNKVCQRDRKVLKKSNAKLDSLEITKYLCVIEEDWIKAIEEGLEYIEKAVKEERQFIRTEGEVVPIEKVKKVSKYSVEHLAKHSNMITHVPENEGDPVIPDSIYMVEKLSDYAVYENRFLYLLLCYLRDFIALRIERIEKLRMTYKCKFYLKKEFVSKKREFHYETSYVEEKYDNPYPIIDEESSKLLQRAQDCQQIVLMLLNTQLMVDVSKVAMIKPPIVKTNVLKMNNNFKRSLALYNYIVEYKGDGYKAEEIVKEYAPFADKIADELVELGSLTSFLTYKYGNDLSEMLENEYQAEEERRRQIEAQKLVEQIKKLKRRVMESGMGMEEYMLALEKRNRQLEADSQELLICKNQILELNAQIDALKQEIVELNRKIEELKQEIEDLNKEIARLNQKYIDDMAALKKQHAQEILELKNAHQKEIEELNQQHENEINELVANYENQINELVNSYENQINELINNYENRIIEINETHQAEINYLNETHENEIINLNEIHKNELQSLEEHYINERETIINDYDSKVNMLNTRLTDLNTKYNTDVRNYSEKVNGLLGDIQDAKLRRSRLIDKYEDKLGVLKSNYLEKVAENEAECANAINKIEEEKLALARQRDFALAELRAIRVENGLIIPTDDFTSKERFEELEREFEAFNRFFKEQWLLTKKAIRKELLWTKLDKYELKAKIKEEKEIKAKEKENKKKGIRNPKETEMLDLSHYTEEDEIKTISNEIISEVDAEDLTQLEVEAAASNHEEELDNKENKDIDEFVSSTDNTVEEIIPEAQEAFDDVIEEEFLSEEIESTDDEELEVFVDIDEM